MSSLKSFVVSDEEDEENFDRVSDLALTLDRRDFSVDGYPVDNKKYPLIGKALLRGKEKAVQWRRRRRTLRILEVWVVL